MKKSFMRNVCASIAIAFAVACQVPTSLKTDESTASRAALATGLTTFYLLEGSGTPSGLSLSTTKSSVTGWQPTRTLSATPTIWYTTTLTGSFASATANLVLWTTSPGTATPVLAELVKTNASGGSGVVLASKTVDVNASGGGNHTTTFSFALGAASFSNELLAVRLTRTGGAAVTAAFNSNDFNSNLALTVSGSVASPSPVPSASPGFFLKVEAENFSLKSDVQTEACSEGTLNVGWIDAGDWMVYPVTIPSAGAYTISYRVASVSGASVGADYNAGAVQLGSVSIPATGGWQTWTTVSRSVTLPAGSINLGINTNTGGFNLNWFSISSSTVSPSPTPIASPTPTPSTTPLIALASGKQMTFQFKNSTNGTFSNSQIYVLVIARNSAGQFCYLDTAGNLVPLVSGQNASSFSYRIGDFPGYQFPTFLDSGRLYVSLGSALDIPINSDVNGNVGVAFPNIENSADPNINKDFEWVEFAVLNNQIWCNTTQVDQFAFPMVMELYSGSASSYSSFGKVGMTERRAALFDAFTASVPAEFQSLRQAHRILAPLHGSFRSGGANAAYYDGYINSIWSQYTSSDLVFTVPQGTFTGRVQADGRLRFTRPGDAASYYVSKPNGDAVWGGLGALATGNTIELVLEAQICAAFHRHVMGNSSTWGTPSQYYLAAPADYYSKFFHDRSLGGKAYGFCYDDVFDQSSTLTTPNPRGIVLEIIW